MPVLGYIILATLSVSLLSLAGILLFQLRQTALEGILEYLVSFAVGFSLPLGAVLLGVSLGKATLVTKRAEASIRGVSGGVLIIAGFYLLVMF